MPDTTNRLKVMKNKSWFDTRSRDPYYRRAKKEGYRSRAAYKLEQLDSKYRILKRGSSVIDLGAAPGGWLQYASRKVGANGTVLGVDKKEIEPLPASNVATLRADITDPSTIEKIRKQVDQADVLLVDLSPNVSGVWEVDVARQVGLNLSALGIAERVLRKGGKMALKIFEGKDSWRIKTALESSFSRVNLFKPPASRKKSSEIYAICEGFGVLSVSANSS